MATAVKIEKGVPLAPHANTGAMREKYPFSSMEIGDSFFLPANGKSASPIRHTVAAAATSRGKKLGMKFATRALENGVRVWRIA